MATIEQDWVNFQEPGPLYRKVKAFILERILKREWPASFQLPSEHDLVRMLGVSRMTIHRALRELTSEGKLTRVQGVGTFVANGKADLDIINIPDIVDDIHARSHGYSCIVHFLQAEPVSPEGAGVMGVSPGDPVFHAYIVHCDNGKPIQLEDRFINPSLVPDFMEQDFKRISPYAYIQQILVPDKVEQVIQAVAPTSELHHFLELEAPEPCLEINRRTWCAGRIVTKARLVHPSSRYRISGSYSLGSG